MTFRSKPLFLLQVLTALILSSVCVGQISNSGSGEFTAAVFEKNGGKLIRNLIVEDFRVFENNREVKIVSVVEESKPLSIVIIPTLGEGKTCGRGWLFFPGFDNPENKTTPFSSILEQNIQGGDELAIITTDHLNTKIRDFDSQNQFSEDFDTFAKFSDSAQKTITTEQIKYTEFGAEPDGESSYTGVETNFVKHALLKGFDYLEKRKAVGNRSVVLILRSVYNPSDLNAADRQNLKKRIAGSNVIVNWFGDNSETIFMKMFTDFPFYGKLPKISGGVKQPCSILQPKKSDELSEAVSGFLNQMRTRYKITYLSADNSNRLRTLKISLTKSGKRKAIGTPQINAPEFVDIKKSGGQQ